MTAHPASLGVLPLSDPNRLGLDYRSEAAALPWTGPIWDVHTHIRNVEAARLFIEVCDSYGVGQIWSMTQLEDVDAIRDAFGDRFRFIAVPNYHAIRNEPDTFGSDFLKRIEGFAEKGVKICKFWAAPRGRDFHPDLRFDSPVRQEAMKLAADCGMMFMVHIADPDTWFATHYKDRRRYDRKLDHYVAFEQALEQYPDIPLMAAHLGGHPEDLEHLQRLLDRHPNLCLDTSATKWMIRELSKHPQDYLAFCRANAGRLLFGSDNVADPATMSYELLASRYWALRVMYETGYNGRSPIVDPDLSLVDPSLPRESTATLRGASFDPATLASVYQHAAERWLIGWEAR